MDPRCPGCGHLSGSSDDICPRCGLARAIPPAIPTVPVGMERSQPLERGMPITPDRNARRSLRMLLVIVVGLILLLFAGIALLVWVLFGA